MRSQRNYFWLVAAVLAIACSGCFVKVDETPPKRGVDVKIDRDKNGVDVDIDVKRPAQP